jgi:hypothetical protein
MIRNSDQGMLHDHKKLTTTGLNIYIITVIFRAKKNIVFKLKNAFEVLDIYFFVIIFLVNVYIYIYIYIYILVHNKYVY